MSQRDVRIGDLDLLLAHGYEGQLGFSKALRQLLRPLLLDSSQVVGNPGQVNLRSGDLRWEQTSWSGGEGFPVLHRGDQDGERRFFESSGIDFSVPGQFSLAKAMSAQGSTGTAPTTVEASTFTPLSGTTVVNGTDMLLHLGASIATSITPAAGSLQVDFYAYRPPPVRGTDMWLGSDLTTFGTSGQTLNGDNLVLSKNGQGARSPTTAPPFPGVGPQAVVEFKFNPPARDTPRAHVTISVHDGATNNIVLSKDLTINATPASSTPVVYQMTFTPEGGHTYRYQVTLNNSGTSLEIVDMAQREVGPEKMTWKVIALPSTVVASGVVDLASFETSQLIASSTFVADGVLTYSLQFLGAGGSGFGNSFLEADKVIYQGISMHKPWCLHLGVGNLIWLVDYDPTPGQPHLFWWDAANSRWTSVAAFGGSGAKPIAMASSDGYGYVVLDDNKVYRFTTAGVTTYSAAFTEGIVGMTVSADRVWILVESATIGTKLYQLDVDATAGLPFAVPGAAAFTFLAKETPTPDKTIVKRMAGTASGVQMFVNNAQVRATFYQYDSGAAAGSPLTSSPDGFAARAMVHALGVTYIAGHFPASNSDGTTAARPALARLAQTPQGSPSYTMADVKLWRDDEPTATVQDLQWYGSDLYVLVSVASTPPVLRLWRIPLGGAFPGTAAFVESEIVVSPSANAARGFAGNLITRVMAWGDGSPYISQSVYPTAPTPPAHLRSSTFDFGLPDEKLLLGFFVDGFFPPGTEMEVLYGLDGDEEKSVGHWTTPGRKIIAGGARFTSMRSNAFPRTTDSGATPVIKQITPLATTTNYDRNWEVFLLCANPGTDYKPPDGLSGGDRLQALRAIADAGALTTFTDYTEVADPRNAPTYDVLARDFEKFALEDGQAVARMVLQEVT